MKIRCIAATLAVTLLSATTLQIVSAQERPERGNREQRGGPGGPGGRFGGGPGGPGGFGGGFGGGMGMGVRAMVDIDRLMVQLIGRQEVQDELELLPDQVDGLAKMNERMRPERPDFDFRNATEEQRNQFMAKMQEQQAERTKQAKDQLEELLLPDQFDRLEQIAVQVAGVSALVSPAISERLGLTKEVTDKMTKDIEASAEKGREMMNAAMRDRDRGFDFNAIREKAQEMRKELDGQLLANLSDDQKAKYEAMKGKPFELRADDPFGGRGGQPGAGGVRGRGQGGPGAAGGPGGRGGFGGRGGPGAGGRPGGRPPQN